MTTHPPKISVTNTPPNFTKSLVIIGLGSSHFQE